MFIARQVSNRPSSAGLTCSGVLMALAVMFLVGCTMNAVSQTRSYPKEIRGYKVERAVVEIKKPQTKNHKARNDGDQSDNATSPGQTASKADSQSSSDKDVDTLIQLGKPQLARVTPLGITFEVPIVVPPVTQKGHVDFLMFEDMVVNGTSVEIDEYHRAFDLPNKEPLTLREPLSFYIYLPHAVLAAVDEWRNSKETWRVSGRVYVFGKFKKGWFSFKRCVPVEINTTMRNPLQNPDESW